MRFLPMCLLASLAFAQDSADSGLAPEEGQALMMTVYPETVELDITGSAPSNYAAGGSKRGSVVYFAGGANMPHSGQTYSEPAVLANGSPFQSSIGVAYIRCNAKWFPTVGKNGYYLTWDIPKATWPGTAGQPAWPSEVYCEETEGTEQAVLTVVLVPDIRPSSAMSTTRPSITAGSGGVALASTLYSDPAGATPYVVSEQSGWKDGILPSGTYTDACVSVRSGTSPTSSILPGQKCRVEELGSTDLLTHEFDRKAGATAGTGYCHFNKNGVAVFHKVSLAFVTNP